MFFSFARTREIIWTREIDSASTPRLNLGLTHISFTNRAPKAFTAESLRRGRASNGTGTIVAIRELVPMFPQTHFWYSGFGP